MNRFPILISVLSLLAFSGCTPHQQTAKELRSTVPESFSATVVQCSQNIEPTLEVKRGQTSPSLVDEPEGNQAMDFWIFEGSVSGTSFTMGALVRNRGPYRHLIRKKDATLHFTRYADGRMWKNVPYSHLNHTASFPVTITSWEDGDSPALHLDSCQEKWIRFRGTIEGAEAAKFLSGKVEQASIRLFRRVDPGWAATASLTDTLQRPTFIDALIENCENTPGCGK